MNRWVAWFKIIVLRRKLWVSVLDDSHVGHTYPLLDLIVHEAWDECPCGPTSEAVKREDGSIGWTLTHHSLDGREANE